MGFPSPSEMYGWWYFVSGRTSMATAVSRQVCLVSFLVLVRRYALQGVPSVTRQGETTGIKQVKFSPRCLVRSHELVHDRVRIFVGGLLSFVFLRRSDFVVRILLVVVVVVLLLKRSLDREVASE
jgi:hypothetical protein